MDKLDLILRKLDVLTNMVAAYGVILVTFMIGVVLYLRDFKERHTIQNLAKDAFQLVLKPINKLGGKIKNMGTVEPVADIPDELKKDFFRKWMERGKMDFIEAECLPLWGGSQIMYRKFMDWCAHEKIIKRRVEGVTKGPNAAWVVADERGSFIRIERILNQSPASGRKTVKQLQ